MHDLNAVKRALVRADVRAVAERTSLPETLIMSMVESNGWDVDLAEREIKKAMRTVADSIARASEMQMFAGGNDGGGKQFDAAARNFRARLLSCFDVTLEPHGVVVVTCVS